MGTERSWPLDRSPSTQENWPMPGIDFRRLRSEITMQQVLDLLGFQPAHRKGDQWYGACPLHASPSRRRRPF
jgi:hypothetical protein